MRSKTGMLVVGLLALLLTACGGSSSHNDDTSETAQPNVVLILLDDMGIDQWTLFGYGGLAPAPMPNIGDIAQAGVQFHNFWSMPACSNGRASLFTGRYPLRTHVMTALGTDDLANYMVNPSEMTLPDLLHTVGYKSALFGKFHMGIQTNNPYGTGMVHKTLGFDYFEGWLDVTGDPSSIDTTAGMGAAEGTYSCGFVPDASHGGANKGACYMADDSCSEMSKTGVEAPGRLCRDQGGIFDPHQSCQVPTPTNIHFENLSGHYVSPLTIDNAGSVENLPSTDPRARTYRTTEVVDAALRWLKTQPKDQPWMVTLSFSADHTPLMQPPSNLLPDTEPDSSNLDCSNVIAQQFLSNQMEEAMDHEVGRFLVSAGLATRDDSGKLIYDPAASNTYIIVVSDNGSLGTVVKLPFDKSRAKSTAYQTGVWNPAIVSGPKVYQPGRSVDDMVNIVDLYQLIGELAGVKDVHKAVPRTLDSQSMLPYLEQPGHASIRTSNYTEVGYNGHANGVLNGPCVFDITTPSCSQITPSAGVCHDNGGTWWGENPDWADPSNANYDPDVLPAGFDQCCAVANWQAKHSYPPVTDIFPSLAYAVRNDDYKLVVNHYESYDPSATNGCAATTSTEFYQINEDVPNPQLDEEGTNLPINSLTAEQQKNYDQLTQQLNDIRNSESDCPADINLDGVVDAKDIAEWNKYQGLSQGKSSWADVNKDGLTDGTDKAQIQSAFGTCP